jgi:hypothetical protein
MRRVFFALAAAALASGTLAAAAEAQVASRGSRSTEGRRDTSAATDQDTDRNRPRIQPLRRRAAAAPCPYVKILYEGARYVELADNRPSMQNVGFTGEIEGLVSDCAYQADQPIELEIRTLFNLGRGPQAQGDQRTYRYWIAVTERNKAVLAKEYFDLPVNFEGQQTASITQDNTILIPRASATVAGDNFEVLVGFEVTPEMAEFNRSGSRFRIPAGQPQTPAQAPAQTPAPGAQ